MKHGGATFRSHRLAWWLTHGVDPADKMVCHHCDNPPCCNPAHLFLGDASANMKDSVAKGRKNMPNTVGEANGYAKLSVVDVAKIRDMIRSGSNNMQIARVFGVTHQMVSRIRRGRAWGQPAMQPKYASLRR